MRATDLICGSSGYMELIDQLRINDSMIPRPNALNISLNAPFATLKISPMQNPANGKNGVT